MRRAKPTAEDIARYAKVRADRKARIEEMAKTVPWAAVAVYRKPMSELPAEVRESLAAESRKMMADAMEDRKAAVANGVRRGKATIRKVADLADKCAACDEAEWGSTEESPGGEVVGCKLITSAVVQGHCLSCPKKWKTAVESGIPPVGCKWRVEGGPT